MKTNLCLLHHHISHTDKNVKDTTNKNTNKIEYNNKDITNKKDNNNNNKKDHNNKKGNTMIETIGTFIATTKTIMSSKLPPHEA